MTALWSLELRNCGLKISTSCLLILNLCFAEANEIKLVGVWRSEFGIYWRRSSYCCCCYRLHVNRPACRLQVVCNCSSINVGRVLEDPVATNLNNLSNLAFICFIYCTICLFCLAVCQTKLSTAYTIALCTFVVLPGLLGGKGDSSLRRLCSLFSRNIISSFNCLERLPVLGWKCICL